MTSTSTAPADGAGRGLRDLVVAAVVAAVVTAVVAGRSLGRGLYLYRDFVTVPDPVWNPTVRGEGQAPRAVPLDAVMTALSAIVPTGVQQQVMLVGAVFLAGLGTAVLLRRFGLAAMLSGAVLAMWNPYVAERLLIGQPPTLLAYSMTPWLVAVVLSRRPGLWALPAVVVLALPAALTPWGGVVAGLVVVLTSCLVAHRRRPAWLVGCLLVTVAWCLPWLVPALTQSTGGADPDGARAFALSSDSPLGVLGSALTLGGIWAPGARPASRDSLLSVVASCLVLTIALAGLVVLQRRGARLRRRRIQVVVLALAWLLPPVAAWVVSTGPGLSLFAASQRVPGVALARDTHRWLGLSALAVAILVGVAVGALAGSAPRRARPSTSPSGGRDGSRAARAVAVGGALVVCSLALLSVPDLPKAVPAAYRPLAMPADWSATVETAAAAADGGVVAVLPWQPFRMATWAGGEPFLDPLPRALPGRVLTSHQLTVLRDGRRLTVDDDQDGVGWATGRLDAAQLRAAGVTAVVVWKGTPGEIPELPAGVDVIRDSEHFAVWRVTRP